VCCRGASARTLPSAPYVSVQKQSLNPEYQPSRESTQHQDTMWVPCMPHLLHSMFVELVTSDELTLRLILSQSCPIETETPWSNGMKCRSFWNATQNP
jgi:hypothetical protein